MNGYNAYYEARSFITDILEKDLIGPVLEDEVLAELPTQYYLTGKLYPQGDTLEVEDNVPDSRLENVVDTYDASISLSNQRNPASLGITCALKKNITKLELIVSYSFYNHYTYEDAEIKGVDISKWSDLGKKPKHIWQREAHKSEIQLDVTTGKVITPDILERGIQIKLFTHSINAKGERLITVALINTNVVETSDIEEISKACCFQTKIEIRGIANEAVFTEVTQQVAISEDEELLELEMLYRNVHCYGQGHGCSVTWDTSIEDPLWVSSTFLPLANIRQMKATEYADSRVLSMEYLANGVAEDVLHSLTTFATAYAMWIKETEQAAKQLESRYLSSAKSNISKCHEAFQRLMNSIKLLINSQAVGGEAWQAFRMANEVMLLQREQTLKKKGKSFTRDKIMWYPFQLAFILQEVASFINPLLPERNKVDLLWFPTGGGKTEAYLGIAAFVIMLRRLKDHNADGVTVIMRYTLRLLTLQQFERASIMIMACDLLRQKYKLGATEIAIGLWVGGKLTPNKLLDTKRILNKLQKGDMMHSGEGNPCQITRCPWCGAEIRPQDYTVDLSQERMLIKCPNDKCEFHNGMPLHFVDEAIYAHAPAFLIATIDKFAQVPLNAKPAKLFGISNNKKRPELIIQDELHLISGPLGTITGIYEAAISRLCEEQGIRAKIIASTATIRNAKKQIMALYGREFTQFPPQGITAKDAYFAVESSVEERPARLYCGLMGVGTTATTALIHVDAALLYATRYLIAKGYPEKVIDNFWTLTGYFNTLRELGGASTQILDEVQNRYRYLLKTKFAPLNPQIKKLESSYDYFAELTSRMDNTQITKIIQYKLNRSYKTGQRNVAYDFVLASNMISVGVDVGRLGVMIVDGQPKTNAEYIQATSRIGRDNPGLVVVNYNAGRSRDRSHYEQFAKYHAAIYKYVEATSLTPFADRARDRGLHALYVSLCRYLIPDLLADESAVNFDCDKEEIRQVDKYILDYVRHVDPQELEAVREELRSIKECWQEATTGGLIYRGNIYKPGKIKNLLKNDTEEDRFRMMNSMRNVDAQSGIYLLGRK